jgi:hypothetical protein
MRSLYLVAALYLLAAGLFAANEVRARMVHQPAPAPVTRAEAPVDTSTPAGWFASVKARCNTLEAVTTLRRSPPPEGAESAGYAAACYALAGRIDRARSTIAALAESERAKAASIVFAVGHPVADAGDDESAGPIMELVIEYQPRNYMALYHAGMSEYILGQHERSRVNLRHFLDIYTANDGWRSNAIEVLRRLESQDAVMGDSAG